MDPKQTKKYKSAESFCSPGIYYKVPSTKNQPDVHAYKGSVGYIEPGSSISFNYLFSSL